MAQKHNSSAKTIERDDDDDLIQGAPLEPIRIVERELTSPAGTTVRVQVPVYPPFRLDPKPPEKSTVRGRKGQRRKAERKKSGDDAKSA